MNFSKKFTKSISLVLLVLLLIPSMPSYAATFPDVKEGHWAYDYIEKMVKLKFINGYDDGTFKPKNSLTYLETLKLVSGLLTLTPEEKVASTYAYSALLNELKLPWGSEDVAKCLYKGVISEAELRDAHSKGMLATGTKTRVSRLVVSIYMAKAMGLQEVAEKKPFVSLPFKDTLSIDAKYHKLLAVLIEAGVLNKDGTGEGMFEQNSAVLREQMAKMLSTAYDYLQANPVPQPVETNAVKGVVSKISPYGTSTIVTIKDKDNKETGYIVDSKTTITLDGKSALIASIIVGQDIEITTPKGSNTATAMKATSVEEVIKGTAKYVYAFIDKITVEYTKDKVVRTLELIVDKNADITINDVVGDLYDIKVGDQVELVTKNNLVLKIKVTPKKGEVSGVIKYLDNERVGTSTKYYVTITDSKNISREYEIDIDADIYRNGKSVNIGDLRVGDKVDLYLEYNLAVEIDAEVVEKEIYGYITEISSRLNRNTEITINNRDTGKEETYTLARDVYIKIDNVTSYVYDLQVGYFVEIIVGGNEITEIYADSIGAESLIRGKVSYVNTKSKEIRLEALSSDVEAIKYGDLITVKLDPNCIITDGRYDLVISDIRSGMSLYVFGYYDGYNFIAKEINVR